MYFTLNLVVQFSTFPLLLNMDGLAAKPLLLREVALIAQREAACNSLHTVPPYSAPKAFHWKSWNPQMTQNYAHTNRGVISKSGWHNVSPVLGQKEGFSFQLLMCYPVLWCSNCTLGTNTMSSPQSSSDSGVKKQLGQGEHTNKDRAHAIPILVPTIPQPLQHHGDFSGLWPALSGMWISQIKQIPFLTFTLFPLYYSKHWGGCYRKPPISLCD